MQSATTTRAAAPLAAEPAAVPIPATGGVDVGSLVAAAARLGRSADERRDELEALCRMPDDLYRAALECRLFRTLVPLDMGGTGGAPTDWFRIGVELARHEPALGWVVTQGAAELGWIAAGAEPSWSADLLGDPLAASASSIAGIGELATRATSTTLKGRWGFNTGCHGATWIGGLAVVADRTSADGSPVTRFGWVPAARASILDDWDPDGLRGTGSNTTVVEEQEVDERWSFSPFDVSRHDRGAHRCLVGNGNWPIAGAVAATLLGAARRALDEATRIVHTKPASPFGRPLAANAAVQRALLRAEGAWNACRSTVDAELGAMWDDAGRFGELARQRRARLFAAHLTASEQSIAIITTACDVTGTTAVDRTHALARVRRDAQVLHTHIAVSGATIEAAAKMSLGLLDADVRI